MRDTFRSLEVSNFRRYFYGQTFSMAGSWMQIVAQSVLVLQLTDSYDHLGYIAAAQMLPVLLVSPWAGVLVDRLPTRRLIVITQLLLAAASLALGLLTAGDSVNLWVVYGISILTGFVVAVDNPARMSFVNELVGQDRLNNAITLNTVAQNASRAVGPAIGGVVIATYGVSTCFIVNAFSFLAVVIAMLSINSKTLFHRQLEPRSKSQLREGLRYAWEHAELRVLLIMMTIIGTLTYEFQVILPAFGDSDFAAEGGAKFYGWLTGAMGVGAVVGGLLTAARSREGVRTVAMQSFFLGITT
jgi:MFS family permease